MLGTYSEFDSATFGVHAHLELHVFDEGLEDGVPLLLQGSESVSGHGDPAVLVFLSAEVGNLHFVEVNFPDSVFVLFGLNSLELHELRVLLGGQLHLLINAIKGHLLLISLGFLHQSIS